MAIYRSDQAQVTFSTEAAQGGYPEGATTVVNGTGACLINDTSGASAGAISFAFDGGSGLSIGEYVQIGPEVSGSAAVNHEAEVRKIAHLEGSSSGTIFLDAPLAFFHADNTEVQVVTSVTSVANDIFIDQIPGVYDTVDCPDPEMTIEPRYFLGTNSKRNFYAAYKGIQNFVGSIGGFIVLNGRALRYPIGKVTTIPSAVEGSNNVILLNGAAKKGDFWIGYDGANADTVLANVILQIGDNTTTVSEVRKVLSVGSGFARLDYPLQFDHADNVSLARVPTTATYTHAITETVDLDTVSWHVHMRDSGETTANDFDRRYYGGMVGSATLSADEGGMLNMSWDGVNFMGMVHNQATSTLGAPHRSETGAVVTPMATLMQTIDATDVQFPTSDPYFFSNGSVTIFGQEVARVRSFSLSISNGEEPRYYLTRRYGNRGPSEIRENRREYSCGMTLALPDSQAAGSTTTTLFKELLLEGDFGGGMEGFNIELVFTRGKIGTTDTDDKITIQIPDGGDAGTGGNAQGAFIRSAPHNITGDNPVQVDADILFRNMRIDVQDGLYYYP